jgi:lipopolysaccharide/colanic/teichoic acid biosynthesis glycosyltransferase
MSPVRDRTHSEQHRVAGPLPEPPARSPARLLKHGLDRLAAACGLLVAAPLLLGVAVALRRRGDGPVLEREPRIGEGGRVFTLVRFALDRRLRHEPRWRLVAGLGLAALPQLWNVLRGDMSLVGPRPRRLGDGTPGARPGLTGLAQVEQLTRQLSFSEVLELDARYAATWSLGLDARILARTLVGVLR